MSYEDYMKSELWKAKRRAVWSRAGDGKCERCRKHVGRDVHHLRYPVILGTEAIEDLILVCEGCHAWLHGKSVVDPDAISTMAYVNWWLGRELGFEIAF